MDVGFAKHNQGINKKHTIVNKPVLFDKLTLLGSIKSRDAKECLTLKSFLVHQTRHWPNEFAIV